jgi:hypothetical protein
METFARYWSKETAGRGGNLDRDETVFEIGDSSRFGANFKAGNTSANVELRPFGGGEGGSTSSNFRQWWGQVDFTGWQLRVGQQSVLDGMFPPGCCIDEGSRQSAFGGWSGRVRQPGLAAFIPIGQGTLKFGLFAPGDLGNDGSGAGTAGAGTAVVPIPAAQQGIDEHVPQIQASYDIKLGPASLKFVGGYNTYDEIYWTPSDASSDISYSIDSWILGGELQSQFGPFTLMWQIHYAVNPTAYKGRRADSIGYTSGLNPRYDASSNTIQDAKEWGSFLRALYKMSDLVTWELGGGYVSQESDGTASLPKIEDDGMFVYLNAQIFLSKTFRFTPEVGYFDARTRDTTPVGGTVAEIEQGDLWYWGAYWRIDF